MRKTALARRYAKALIEIGVEENCYEKFGTELRDAFAVFKGYPELMKVLLNPMFKVEERVELVSGVTEKLGQSGFVKKFFVILVDTGNINLLDDICEAYFAMEDEIAGRIRVTVVSPTEASDELLDGIKEKLISETGKKVILTQEKDPNIIGGFVINIGNTMIDASLKTQLERMREKTLEGVV
ncbi:MAG: ATP synthase F1 subunit delta [Thermodesulfobacteriota bacterium]